MSFDVHRINRLNEMDRRSEKENQLCDVLSARYYYSKERRVRVPMLQVHAIRDNH